MAVATDNLNPKHTYVPWIVGQGQHTDAIQNEITASLFDYVCANYSGPNKSSACPSTKTKKPKQVAVKKVEVCPKKDAALPACVASPGTMNYWCIP